MDYGAVNHVELDEVLALVVLNLWFCFRKSINLIGLTFHYRCSEMCTWHILQEGLQHLPMFC
jgi:hypothetical protein